MKYLIKCKVKISPNRTAEAEFSGRRHISESCAQRELMQAFECDDVASAWIEEIEDDYDKTAKDR